MTFEVEEDNYLAHYGILRKSGRYPWGSGGSPSTRAMSFFDHVEKLRSQGLSDPEIARGFGMTTTQLRDTNTIARNAKKAADIAAVQRYANHGLSNIAIGKKMGINESSVRALRAAATKDKNVILEATSNMLRDKVAEHGFIDVGKGVENHLGISKEKLGSAVAVLKDEGYQVIKVQQPQLGTTHKTTVKVLAPKGTTYKDVVTNMDKIHQIMDMKSDDGGRSFLGLRPPISISSKRLDVKYSGEGGEKSDGVIFVRPGAKDLSLGNARYAQVRIAVDGTHYLKGMAMYKDDLPTGVDLQFNTNKTRAEAPTKLDALKKIKDDPDNPFGSVVDQIYKRNTDGTYVLDEHGHKIVSSAMNKVNEEGQWAEWQSSISSQMLSKQSAVLAKQQLDKSYADKRAELDEILSLTNPTVRKSLLDSYAEDADASAWRMKAKALPGQASHVILPVNSLKDTEIYAPNYEHGSRVVLIRYPHGGVFEIPELIVNNNHPEAKKLIGTDAPDAVGINHKVAKHLSGADFDGDTVLVIPNNAGHVRTSPALDGLKGFDPQTAYPGFEGMPKVKVETKNIEMGKVSNLITDMTIKGATPEELARAVRHSMVVIDAEKHNLNYKQSAIDNGIVSLREKYQTGPKGGASTLISKRKREVAVPERKPRSYADGGPIDKKTGKLVYEETGRNYVDKSGKTIYRTSKVKQVLAVDDVHEMSSGTKMEDVYADHANKVKDLANQARKEYVATPSLKYAPSARKTYAEEVKSLNAKLNEALKNAPRERQAQIFASTVFSQKKAANPDMDKAEEKKLKYLALEEARHRFGAEKKRVVIEPREWEAIQNGAVTNHMLEKILANTDKDKIKILATPRPSRIMDTVATVKAKGLLASGRTQREVADILGVSLTTLKNSLKEGQS